MKESTQTEMLTVSRKEVQELYAALQSEHKRKDVELYNRISAEDRAAMLFDLFGSKCLPNEACNVASSDVASSKPKPNEEDDPDLAQRLAFLNSLSDEHSKPKQAEPKFKRCEKVITPSGEVCIIEDTHFENGSWLYLVGDPAQWVSESDLEPYTEPKENIAESRKTSQNCDKEFDNILKDSFSKERRLNIAVTILGNIIQSGYYSLSEKYCKENMSEMAKLSLQLTDALIVATKSATERIP